ncbi:MAG TPA: sterol desaturase family protein [Allosphingosinicella sp.]|nr:sterol desaturase family protein [Allosphingosinicella sp.]
MAALIDIYLDLLFWSVLLVLLFALVEHMLAAERAQPPRRWLFNLCFIPAAAATIVAADILLGPLYVQARGVAGGGLLPILDTGESGLASQLAFILVYVFAWDVAQYTLHRIQHAVPALWETHRFHHDETAINAAAATRVHPTSYVLSVLAQLPLVLLFGPQVPHVAAAFLLFSLWGLVNHANVRIGFGPLTPFVSGPQWHRIHHSIDARHRDRNFATFFPVIDIIFGTYYRPSRDEYPATGLEGEQASSLKAATILPFVNWYRAVRSRFALGAEPNARPKAR